LERGERPDARLEGVWVDGVQLIEINRVDGERTATGVAGVAKVLGRERR